MPCQDGSIDDINSSGHTGLYLFHSLRNIRGGDSVIPGEKLMDIVYCRQSRYSLQRARGDSTSTSRKSR